MKRICLLGAGRMGAMHAESFVGHPKAKLTVVADVLSGAAETLAQRTGARATEDIEGAIEDPDVDGVIISTSTDTHVSLIEKVAAAGKPIFCEKPVDLDIVMVEACLAVVEKSGVPFQIGFNRRFDPHFGALHSKLRAGAIGDLELVKITSRDPAPPPMGYLKVSGGLFRDMMIHDFDLARWILGDEPVELHATASCLVDPAIAEAGDIDTAVVTMKTAKGVICSIENSRRAVYGYDQRVEVLGSKGMLQAGNPQPTTVSQWGKEQIAGDPLLYFANDRYPAAYRAELDHFVEVIDGATPSPGPHDARAALVLANAARESLESGKSVKVEL